MESLYFLGSDFIRTKELPEILKRRNQGMTVIPVLVGPCVWKRVTWLKTIQMNPGDVIPLSKMEVEDQEDIFIEIVDEIGQALDNYRQSDQAHRHESDLKQ
ncbi:hypothetical protein GMMP15_370018 [Candidatus Magnetomoraceae bacterium gMMP-15]